MLYSKMAELYSRLEQTPARLKKTRLISDFLEETEADELAKAVPLLEGRVFPVWDHRELGIANQLMAKAIASTAGYSESDIESRFRKSGDFGLIIEELLEKKRQRTLFKTSLTIGKVFENLQKIAGVSGKGAIERKMGLVSELLSSAKPVEAKYIARTVIGDLRVGVAEGVVRDAIATAFFSDIVWAENRVVELVKETKGKGCVFEKGFLEKLREKGKITEKEIKNFREKNKVSEKSPEDIEKMELWKVKTGVDFIVLSDDRLGNRLKDAVSNAVEWAWFMEPDYGRVAATAKEGGLAALKKVSLEVGKPFVVLLGEKAPSLEEAIGSFERVAIEFKYDGARVQAHKKGKNVWLYTRRLEDITKQFPELVEMVRKHVKAGECIIEGEILGVDKNNRPVPFQLLSQRVHRKYDIEETAKEIPVQVNWFDVVYVNGRMLFDKRFEERRKELEKVIETVKNKFQLAEELVTKDLKKAEEFYRDALRANQEGVMVKNLDAYYQPGRRVAGGWLKVKPIMETLDLVIIGATWGTGKRTGWLGSLVLGCREPGTGKFLECGMIGTGIKEKEGSGVNFEELTRLLKPDITREEGTQVWIRPKVVVEVAYEEIQKSPNYNSGYALRFPRVVGIREDKGCEEADGVERVAGLFKTQKGKR